jgi:DNA-binding NarL/FixJ family response regulator
VLLVDGSIIALHGLKIFLSDSDRIIVVGTARTEGETFATLTTCHPDAVILTVRVERGNGINICRTIRESYPKAAGLFFSAYDDKNILQSVILAGAQGHLLKIAFREALVKSHPAPS